MPRTTAIAEPASTMPARCSSAFSCGPAGSSATVVAFVCEREQGGDDEDDRPQRQHPFRTAELQERQRRHHHEEAHDRPDERELRVRFEQLVVGAYHRRHERGLRHGVALGHHQQQEGEGEQQERVDIADHQGAHDRATDRRTDQDDSTATLHAVERRPDHRGDYREGRSGEQQVESDAPPRRIGRDVEEQRTGQSHGDGGVASHHERMSAGETGERRRDEALLGLDGRAHRDGVERRRHWLIVRAGGRHPSGGTVAQRGLEEHARPGRQGRPQPARRGDGPHPAGRRAPDSGRTSPVRGRCGCTGRGAPRRCRRARAGAVR